MAVPEAREAGEVEAKLEGPALRDEDGDVVGHEVAGRQTSHGTEQDVGEDAGEASFRGLAAFAVKIEGTENKKMEGVRSHLWIVVGFPFSLFRLSISHQSKVPKKEEREENRTKNSSNGVGKTFSRQKFFEGEKEES